MISLQQFPYKIIFKNGTIHFDALTKKFICRFVFTKSLCLDNEKQGPETDLDLSLEFGNEFKFRNRFTFWQRNNFISLLEDELLEFPSIERDYDDKSIVLNRLHNFSKIQFGKVMAGKISCTVCLDFLVKSEKSDFEIFSVEKNIELKIIL